MREITCVINLRDKDVEIVGHWLMKVERKISEMLVKELWVDCVTQLLTENAHSWWETIRERRSKEVLTWQDFRAEFEE
jgi:hypothetical protein